MRAASRVASEYGTGPYLRPELLHVALVLQRSDQQHRQADPHHHQRELPRSERVMHEGRRLALAHELKELMEGEAERDERRRCAYPRHQRALVRQTRAIERHLRGGESSGGAVVMARCVPGGGPAV